MLIQTHIFDRYADAKEAIAELEHAGIKAAAISIIGRGGDDLGTLDFFTADRALPVRDDQSLLDQMGLLCIEGVGPVAVAGSLPGLVIQTGLGGNDLLMALITSGHRPEEAEILAEAVHRGATLVSVVVDQGRIGGVAAILEDNHGVMVEERGAAYRDEGWTRYDANLPPYTSEQVFRERMRHEQRA